MKNLIFRKDGTAQGVAKQRLVETLAQPNQRIIDDPYAHHFVFGASIIKQMGHAFNVWLTHKVMPGLHEHLIARTRFIDDLVEKWTAHQAEQYVILGAGYDSRAHRLTLPPTLKIFEVDQLEVQNRKRSKLPHHLAHSENITYVSVDFSHQTLKNQLLDAGYNPNKSTLFTLEGVSQYITKDALSLTLADVAELTQKTKSTLCISYVNTGLLDNPKAYLGRGYPYPARRVFLIKEAVARLGEPWISFYSNQEMEDVLSSSGFLLTENKTLADLNSHYFTPVGRPLSEHHLMNLEHFVVAQNYVK